MKIIVMSDSHGDRRKVEAILAKHADADLFIHLGDGEREMHALLLSNPSLNGRLHYLQGNCDSGFLISGTQTQLVLTLPYGHRILAAHGHYYQVKFGTARIVHEARELHADIVLYGHTHVRECRYDDGVYVINPGSLGCPRDGKAPGYVVLDVSESGIMPNPVIL
ncbi:MAG: metallophosphoesterase [Oscillospiraceae bacterium]|nr:metallophosphoesterase [Oscillospiraceae bacterium]